MEKKTLDEILVKKHYSSSKKTIIKFNIIKKYVKNSLKTMF